MGLLRSFGSAVTAGLIGSALLGNVAAAPISVNPHGLAKERTGISGLSHARRHTNGAFIHQTTFSYNCWDYGLGVEYDPKTHVLWYTCSDAPGSADSDLIEANVLTGSVINRFNLNHGLGAIAYDSYYNGLWAGFSKKQDCNIYWIDLNGSTPTITLAFDAYPSGCSFPAGDDGLAFSDNLDGTGTLYLSPDGQANIQQYTVTRNPNLTGFTVAPSALTSWAGVDNCFNSGLAVGGPLVYEGSDGCSEVWGAYSNAPGTLNTTLFAGFNHFATNQNNNGVRDEDLSCDSTTYRKSGQDVMWSREVANPPHVFAFEIPKDSCGSGGVKAGVNVWKSCTQKASHIVCTIGYANNGSTPVHSVHIEDPLPGGLTLSAHSGGPCGFSVTGTVLHFCIRKKAQILAPAAAGNVSYAAHIQSGVLPGTRLCNCATIFWTDQNKQVHTAASCVDLTVVATKRR